MQGCAIQADHNVSSDRLTAQGRTMHSETTTATAEQAHELTTWKISDYFTRRMPLERPIGLLLLLPTCPILLMLAVVVRATSRGPAIYRQQRVGKEGKPFDVYKLRTMIDNAEHISGPVWCQPGDSRITPVGKLLRLLHLDELPQLLNVVRGEMSLVGPRPERPEMVETLSQQIPDYVSRLRVLPGITGLAQIELPPDSDQQSVRNKTELDLQYIHSASASQDLRIVCQTVLKMLCLRPTPQPQSSGPKQQLAPCKKRRPQNFRTDGKIQPTQNGGICGGICQSHHKSASRNKLRFR
jgi:lipopolysaccharide/colanic/teichoic acid biosynthesis glycosyltransferase